MRETKFGFNFEELKGAHYGKSLREGCKLLPISYAELCVCALDATHCVRTNKRRQIYDIAEGLERGRRRDKLETHGK